MKNVNVMSQLDAEQTLTCKRDIEQSMYIEMQTKIGHVLAAGSHLNSQEDDEPF